MRIYNGYKKHYQYQILVNLLLLLFLFIVIAFVIKNYFKPFLSIIILSFLFSNSNRLTFQSNIFPSPNSFYRTQLPSPDSN